MATFIKKIALIFFFSIISFNAYSQGMCRISGKVISDDNKPIPYASIYVKDSPVGCSTTSEGTYHLAIPTNECTITVSAMGYEQVEQQVKISRGREQKLYFKLKQKSVDLEKVEILANGVNIIKETAYNVFAIDAKAMHNSSSDIASALQKAPGVKLRESGGLGSDMRFSMDGFSGRHIKFFIDGVPMDGIGRSFDINNIPINFAERLEIYKGVAPVEFGADALGGVVNIVTGRRRGSYIDASYSFGSFNTHKSYINIGHTANNGFTFELSAFQNYSDNDYKIKAPVKNLDNGQINTDDLRTVRRFHDRYHNEAIIAKAGVVGKKWADKLIAGINLSQSDKEIQQGVDYEIVFGDKKQEAYTISPSLQYFKRDFFVKGLNVNLTANYNFNVTHNIDTSSRAYNWYGEWISTNSIGEQREQDAKHHNDNWNTTFNASYYISPMHSIVLNNVLSGFERETKSSAETSGSASNNESFEKISRKNITGLSYKFNYHGKWNLSVFGKYYSQYSKGPRNTSETGGYSYVAFKEKVHDFGYGAAGTVFLNDFQLKLSYEQTYRLPTTDELFGDQDLELGKIDLKPENSQNYNASISFGKDLGRHSLFIETGVLFRQTKDYIYRDAKEKHTGGKYYASYTNFGKVNTMGLNVDLRYNYSNWFSAGGNLTSQNIRNKEKYVSSGSKVESTTYNVRMKNMPYFFYNADASFFIHNVAKKGNTLTVSYDNLYVHSFPLHWENHGSSEGKKVVEEQLVHNLSFIYVMNGGKYNLSFECRNFTNEDVRDNYNQPKAGRAFYGKFRIFLKK